VRVSLPVALGAFAIGWCVLMSIHLATNATDVPRYQLYGTEMRHGLVPYRDFAVEYPPAALVPFELPALVSTGTRGYRIAFEVLMGLCGAGALACSAVILRHLGGSVLPGLAFVAAATLALGPLALGHFDLWPALLVSASLAALAHDRRVVSGALVGVAAAAKVYPAVLVPIAVAWLWRTHGSRDAARYLAAAVAAALACFVPFFVLAPHGVVSSLTSQADRPLQLESSAAAALLATHQLLGRPLAVSFSHASVNLGGKPAAAGGAGTTVLEIVALLAIWIAFARRRRDARGLAIAATAAVLAFVSLGKVFSPQFLIWLIPLAPLLGGVLGLSACTAVAAAVVLTRAYFPGRWSALIRFEALPTWLLVARDGVLLALLGTLIVVVMKPTARWPSLQRIRRATTS